ncbi:MAG: helix-turn-helix domain-containing protein [Bryobacterales bacterium]|nr:helix-turn-helix domain-containing protein [Bryobacterales bacterium]
MEAQRARSAPPEQQEPQEQIGAYKRLHMGNSKDLVLEAVEDLPKTLIRARIASGMTQERLAHRLGIKSQQIQRYEATEYESASFASSLRRLDSVFNAPGPPP